MEPTELKGGKATIYTKGMFGYSRYEAREFELAVAPYAQYPNAVHVKMLLPKKRKWCGYVDTYHPSTMVLDGWGHPTPPNPFGNYRVSHGMLMKESRFLACAPEYSAEFNTAMDTYLAGGTAKVLADFRGGA